MSSVSDQNNTVAKDAVAQKLANAHRAVDPDISAIYRLVTPGCEGDPTEPIKLLEITSSSTASGIIPVGLPAHAPSGILFPSVIVEITPVEFLDIQSGKTTLPNGWQFDASKKL